MEIGLLIIYMLGSGIFVLALCLAAARPMPRPDGIVGSNEENNRQYLYEIATTK